MKRTCIALADATRARIFTFEELDAQPGVRTQELEERFTLVHPARRRRPSELFTESRPSSDRAPSGRGFAHSDHRDDAIREMDRQFAGEIAARVDEVARSHGCSDVILAASPRMLGLLRTVRRPLGEAGMSVRELDRDLVRLTPAEVQDFLARLGYLPERERIAQDLA